MSEQAFSFKDYSLTTLDLIPDEDVDEDLPSEADTRARQYARLGKLIDLEDFIGVVCERLHESVALQSVLQEVLEDPPDRERPRLHVSDMLRLSESILAIAMDAADEMVEKYLTVEGD